MPPANHQIGATDPRSETLAYLIGLPERHRARWTHSRTLYGRTH